MTNYQLLLTKLDEFIRKYYQYQLIRGGIYLLALFLASGLLFTVLEYYGHFSKAIRTGLFYTFMAVNVSALVYWVGLPLIHLLQLGQVISHEAAARVIGQHFPDVKDKLLNTLQLQQMATDQGADQQLIAASINQRIEDLKPVPFSEAIDLSETKRYLKYAAAPLLLLVIVSFISPRMVLDSTERLLKHRTYYEEQAPFSFELVNDSLQAVRQEAYTVELNLDGNTLPDAVYVLVDGNRYRMNKEDVDKHQYTIRNLREDFEMQFEANGFYSSTYEVNVLPQPRLRSYQVKLDYPNYTRKADEVRQNVGDLDIPEGTEVTWQFKTNNAEQVKVAFQDTVRQLEPSAEDQFSVSKRVYSSQPYQIKLANQHMVSPDSIEHYLSVVPDAYPKIKVEQREDSLSRKRQFFSGEASDDYGLSQLSFRYKYTRSDDTAKTNRGLQTEQLSLDKGQTLHQFYHTFDLNKLSIEPGDELTYYFEVYDNDGINGRKSSRSQQFTFRAPTEDDLKEQMDKTQEAVKDQLASASKKARKLQDQLEKARQKLLNKDKLSWEDKQFVKETMKQQKSLRKQIQNLQQQYRDNLRQQNEYQQLSEQMKEQYERMNEIMNKASSEEMQKEMEKLEDLLDKEDKQAIQEQMEQLRRQNKGTQKQLDRSLELYKQMALEQKMRSTANELEDLAKKQKELTEKPDQKSKTDQNADGSKKEQPEGDNSEEASDNDKGGEEDTNKQDSSGKENKDGNSNKGEQQDQKAGKNQQQGSDEQQSADQQSAEDQQESLNEDFKDIDEELGDIDELQQKMQDSQPADMDELKKQSQETQKLMQKSLQKLRQQNSSGASQKQQKASEKMKQMSKQMRKQMSKMSQESLQLNYKRVRQILENLIHFSQEQEDLIKKFDNINNYNPQFVKNARKQTQLRVETEMIEDSLQALSQKVMQIESTVNREIEDINYYMEKVREYISDRQIGKIRSSQQYIMTAANNLAVMLSELMGKMQQQMASQMKGGQMCQKPKPGQMGKKSGKKMGQLKKMQKKLGQQLKQLKKGKQSDRQGASSKEMARLQRMQQKIRQQMREMQKNKEMKGDKEGQDQLKEVQELMKEQEKNIINNNVTGETFKRQQQIEVKMLEAQEAQRTQGRDKKRKSKTAQDLFQKNPPELDEYKEERERQIELLQSVPPKLRGYYRLKVQEYFKNIQ